MSTVIATGRDQSRVIGLVCTAHFMSHFYILLLPPLFPVLRDSYGVGFTELAFAVSAFSLTTGIAQAPVGFLVDRFGAPKLLIAGMLLESLAFVLIGMFPVYPALVGLMVVAGLANAVYHPADYAILNARVDEQRMGRAFSFHTSAGLLGAAMAPVTMATLMLLGDWRSAVITSGAIGLCIALLLMANGDLLREARADIGRRREPADGQRSGMSLLFSLPVLMGVLFFVGIGMTGHAMSTFGVSVLAEMYAAPLEQVAPVLTCYLFAGPVGVLLGGWIADRVRRHDQVAACCFALVAACVFAVAGLDMPLLVTALLFTAAGLFAGVVSPSRDMMIRAVTPPGEMGKVFGFVSTGFNIGGILAPPLYGFLLDTGDPSLVFYTAGVISLLTIGTVLVTGEQGRRARTYSR
ncbi:MAG: MFS transporter [Gammaproteobacteria bacterium]|nr:MFS transporter [Gammaproteobacteria bacterium]